MADTLSSRELFQAARVKVRTLPRVTVPDLAEYLGVTCARAREVLVELEERGIIERAGKVHREQRAGKPGRHAITFDYVPPPPGPTQRRKGKTPEQIAEEQFREVLSARGQNVAQRKQRRVRQEVRELLALCEEHGCTVEKMSKHYLIYHPDGYPITTCPVSPSDWRGLLNVRGDVRRAGILIP